jgi:hypothetical protein
MDKYLLPRDVMGSTLWSFIGTTFDDPATFSEEVRQYHIDVTGKDTWAPDLVVLPVPHVQLAYEYWDDNDDQIEDVLDLKSSNGRDFTALDLLFQLHNAVVEEIRDGDHHFFEGLTLDTEVPTGEIPQYLLNLGS